MTLAQLSFHAPFASDALLAYLRARAVRGVEEVDGGTYRRSVRLAHGPGVIALTPHADRVEAELHLADARDRDAAIAQARALLDLDTDPRPVVAALGADPLLGALVRAHPGRRIPGTVDGFELAVRAIVGQQISVAGAATVTATLAERFGEPLPRAHGTITHLFPAADALAQLTPDRAPMPASRARTLQALAQSGIAIAPGRTDRAELLALPGVGPWTADYIAMRALRDPDVLLATDLVIRKAVRALGCDDRPRAVVALGERWRPYRSSANLHLWGHAATVAREKPRSPG